MTGKIISDIAPLVMGAVLQQHPNVRPSDPVVYPYGAILTCSLIKRSVDEDNVINFPEMVMVTAETLDELKEKVFGILNTEFDDMKRYEELGRTEEKNE